MSKADPSFKTRSIRTLAWLGDVEFERIVRTQIARQADWLPERLDRIRARVVCSEGQASLLEIISPQLNEEELAIVRRGRNASLSGSRRSQRNVKAYRSATGFEALIAYWMLVTAEGESRLKEILEQPLHEAIQNAVASTR